MTSDPQISQVKILAASVNGLKEALTDLSDMATELTETIAEQEEQILQLEQAVEWRDKPLWKKLLFRQSGKPKKALRRVLFHTSGKPRGMFRDWVLTADGQPRDAFRKWMSSPAYQVLPRAVRVASLTPNTVGELSRNGERSFMRLAATRRSIS